MCFASFALTVRMKCEELSSCFAMTYTGVWLRIGGVPDALKALGTCSGGGGDEGGTTGGGAGLKHREGPFYI